MITIKVGVFIGVQDKLLSIFLAGETFHFDQVPMGTVMILHKAHVFKMEASGR